MENTRKEVLIPGSPNEAPLKRLREIIKDEARLRTVFEAVLAEESKDNYFDAVS